MSTTTVRAKVAAMKTAIDALDTSALRADTATTNFSNVQGIKTRIAIGIDKLKAQLQRDLDELDRHIASGS